MASEFCAESVLEPWAAAQLVNADDAANRIATRGAVPKNANECFIISHHAKVNGKKLACVRRGPNGTFGQPMTSLRGTAQHCAARHRLARSFGPLAACAVESQRCV